MQPALLLVLLALLLLTGCGAGEGEQEQAALPQPLAAELAGRSDAVAEHLDAGDGCAALAEAEALQEQAIAAVNAGRVPPRYQEELTSAVGSLVASIRCTPAPPPAPTRTEEDDDDDGDEGDGDSDDSEDDKRGPGEGAGKGKGKGKKGRG